MDKIKRNIIYVGIFLLIITKVAKTEDINEYHLTIDRIPKTNHIIMSGISIGTSKIKKNRSFIQKNISLLSTNKNQLNNKVFQLIFGKGKFLKPIKEIKPFISINGVLNIYKKNRLEYSIGPMLQLGMLIPLEKGMHIQASLGKTFDNAKIFNNKNKLSIGLTKIFFNNQVRKKTEQKIKLIKKEIKKIDR
ncbi:MAG: hypothetical protein VW378_01275 [bacterium]